VPFEYERNELTRLIWRDFLDAPSLDTGLLPPSESLCVDGVEIGELPLEDGLATFGG
jgi:hypothetical protein